MPACFSLYLRDGVFSDFSPDGRIPPPGPCNDFPVEPLVSRGCHCMAFFIVLGYRHIPPDCRPKDAAPQVDRSARLRPNNTAPPFPILRHIQHYRNVQKMSFSISRYSVIQKYTHGRKKTGFSVARSGAMSDRLQTGKRHPEPIRSHGREPGAVDRRANTWTG